MTRAIRTEPIVDIRESELPAAALTISSMVTDVAGMVVITVVVVLLLVDARLDPPVVVELLPLVMQKATVVLQVGAPTTVTGDKDGHAGHDGGGGHGGGEGRGHGQSGLMWVEKMTQATSSSLLVRSHSHGGSGSSSLQVFLHRPLSLQTVVQRCFVRVRVSIGPGTVVRSVRTVVTSIVSVSVTVGMRVAQSVGASVTVCVVSIVRSWALSSARIGAKTAIKAAKMRMVCMMTTGRGYPCQVLLCDA